MLKNNQILDEKDPRVRAKNVDVTFPLKKEEKQLLYDMLENLIYSNLRVRFDSLRR